MIASDGNPLGRQKDGVANSTGPSLSAHICAGHMLESRT